MPRALGHYWAKEEIRVCETWTLGWVINASLWFQIWVLIGNQQVRNYHRFLQLCFLFQDVTVFPCAKTVFRVPSGGTEAKSETVAKSKMPFLGLTDMLYLKYSICSINSPLSLSLGDVPRKWCRSAAVGAR